jgi:phosphatidylglycerophosphatase A
MLWLSLAFATGFGTGFSPFASGTVGTFVGMAIYWFMAPPYASWLLYIFGMAILIALSIPVATIAEGHYQKKDDGRVVIDEVVGYLVTMLFAPHTWTALWLGFILFRIFDIIKPPPARNSQALPGGWGIVVDDLMAGVYSCICLHVILVIIEHF